MMGNSEDQGVCQVPTDMFHRASGMDALVLSCLWSNPVVNAVGVTARAANVVAEYTGLSVDATMEAFGRLLLSGQIIWDKGTEEALVPDWLQFNYLVERTPAALPECVLSALEEVHSPEIMKSLVREIARLDVQFDATATPSRNEH